MSRSAIILIAVVAAIAVLASATPFARADAAPPKSAPADPMPNPNGFDYVVKAAGMVVEPEVVAQVIKDPSTLRNPAIMKQAVAVLQQNEPDARHASRRASLPLPDSAAYER